MFLNPCRPNTFEVIKPAEGIDLVPRSGHRVAVDNKYLYCWGGFNPEYWEVENDEHTSYPMFKEMWRYQFSTNHWCKLAITGDIPEGLASHTMIKLNHHILHLGGSGVPFGQTNSNAVYDLDLQTLEWKCLVPEVQNWKKAQAPRAKYGQSLSHVEGYLYLVGGTTGFTYDMEVNRLNLTTLKWEHLPAVSKYLPEERYRHDTVHYAGKLYVFGGGTALVENDVNVIDAFHIASQEWEKVTTLPYHDPVTGEDVFPAARKCHSCHLFKHDIYLIGGICGDTIEKTLWKLHVPSLQWIRMDHLTLPKPVYFHGSAISQEGCLLVFGGVTQIDVQRTNFIQCTWLDVPSLKTISWSGVRRCLDITKLKDNSHTLLQLGVPENLIDVT